MIQPFIILGVFLSMLWPLAYRMIYGPLVLEVDAPAGQKYPKGVEE